MVVSNRILRLIAAFFIVLLCFTFYWSVLFYTHGNLSLPLDDSFIYFQLAKNTALGHFMEWTSGEGFSSAATSPLYVLILAIGHAIGFQGDLIIIWAFIFGVACLVASFFLLSALSRQLLPRDAHPAAIWLVPGLFILTGTHGWAYLSGMETGLFATVMLATLLEAIRCMDADNLRRPWRLAVMGSLLSVLRPEGLFLSLMLAGIMIWRALATGEKGRRFRSTAWLLMAAPALLWLVLIIMATGHSAPAPMMQKSYFYDPQMTPYLFFAKTSFNIRRALHVVYLGGHSPPLFAVVFCIGLFPMIYREAKKRVPGKGILLGLWLFIGGLSTMMSLTSDHHHFRYQIPFFSIFLLGGGLGLAVLYDAASQKLRPLVAGLAGFFLLVQLLGLPGWIDTYGINSKNIFDQQITMGRYIDRHLPEDAHVGLNDAGAIAYYSHRRCFDVLGLGTEGQSRWFRSGAGSVFEHFERFDRDQLPDYFAVFPRWWSNPDILAKEIYGITLLDNTICGDAHKGLFKANWSILGSGALPLMGPDDPGVLVDSVDVADLICEKSHSYESSRHTIYTSMPPHPGLEKVADGGRKILCGQPAESMTVNLDSGGSLVMVGRFTATGSRARLQVKINGTEAGIMEIGDETGWQEPNLAISVPVNESGETLIQIDCLGQGWYQAYHYWFFRND